MTDEQAAGDPVSGRLGFWRGGFWRVALTNLFTSAAVVALVWDYAYTASHPPESLYFFTDSRANLIQNTPLTQPVMPDADLMAFTAQAILAVYNFDYEHYRETLSREASPSYTVKGWNGVVTAIEKTRNLDEIKAQAMVVSAKPEGGPEILNSRLYGDHLAWSIRLPIRVTYANSKEHRDMALMVTATVVRVPTAFHPEGVAIDGFVADPPRFQRQTRRNQRIRFANCAGSAVYGCLRVSAGSTG